MLQPAIMAKKPKHSTKNGPLKEIWRKHEGQGFLVFETSKRRRNRFLRSGQCAEDSNKIPGEVGSLGKSLEEIDGCLGRRAEAHRRWSRTGRLFRACSVSFGPFLISKKGKMEKQKHETNEEKRKEQKNIKQFQQTTKKKKKQKNENLKIKQKQ